MCFHEHKEFYLIMKNKKYMYSLAWKLLNQRNHILKFLQSLATYMILACEHRATT